MAQLPPDNKELNRLLRESAAKVRAMSPKERNEMFRLQSEGIAKAEASWPKAKYIWVYGVKVYESMEDYWND